VRKVFVQQQKQSKCTRKKQTVRAYGAEDVLVGRNIAGECQSSSLLFGK